MNQQNANAETYILFEIAGTTYGVTSRTVQQMEMVEHITPLPNAPAFVEGVVFTRAVRRVVAIAASVRRRRANDDICIRDFLCGHLSRVGGTHRDLHGVAWPLPLADHRGGRRWRSGRDVPDVREMVSGPAP